MFDQRRADEWRQGHPEVLKAPRHSDGNFGTREFGDVGRQKRRRVDETHPGLAEQAVEEVRQVVPPQVRADFPLECRLGLAPRFSPRQRGVPVEFG